jgi:hypothetical protein
VDTASWDRDAIARFGRILDWSDSVLEEFSGWFNGKTSPVHLFWHGLDLAVTRFSGRPGVPMDADPVTQEAYFAGGHLVRILGRRRQRRRRRVLLLHRPEPDGLRDQPLSAGEWIEFGSGSLAILPYETVRTARDPRQGLLAFCQSAYEAGAASPGWDIASFESTWCPSPRNFNNSTPARRPLRAN